MLRTNVVSDGFRSPNGRAFLYPILRNQHQLRDAGVDVHVFDKLSDPAAACDRLLIDSKVLRDGWGERKAETKAHLERLQHQAGRVLFFDTSDSAGWILGDALPHVDAYYKSQLLADRTAYLRPLYGRRAYSDYYHRTEGVTDDAPETHPQVTDPSLLSKLGLSWNSGFADYSLHGPSLMAAYQRTGLRAFLRRPRGFAAPDRQRPLAISCRMGLAYSRNSVAHQRRRIHALLRNRVSTDKLNRRRYYSELSRSRVVISPFGLGEITLKDFEVFIAGATLLKPDMTHMDTWPEFYTADETMLSFRWDLTDLEHVLQRALDDPRTLESIAEAGQTRYRTMLATDAGCDAFCEHLRQICA